MEPRPFSSWLRLLVAVSTLAIGLSAEAKLSETDLDSFSASAGCMIEGLVRSVSLLTESESQGIAPMTLDLAAQVEIVDVWRTKTCPELASHPGPIRVLFSREVHSSHPHAGDFVILTLRENGGYWFEAVYGRSAWQSVHLAGGSKVIIDWRNDFLTCTGKDFGESGACPTVKIRSLLEGTWNSD